MANSGEQLDLAAPTALHAFASSLGLLPSYQAAGAREAAFLRSSATRERGEAAATEAVMERQAGERAAARPAAPTIPAPPSSAPRPFLTPGPSVLSQLQGVLTGITQIALGVGGLRGGGHAIGAVAGLKGAMEGWQAGDRERADAALRDWQAASEKLQADHRNRLEEYRTLLTDQQMDMANRLEMTRSRARIHGYEALALAAERGQIKEVLDLLATSERHGQDYALRSQTLQKQIEQFQAESARHQRDYEATQKQRDITNQRAQAAQTALQAQRTITNARADRLEKFRENTSGQILKLQQQDVSLGNKLVTADIVEEAVGILASRKLLATGPTTPDAFKAWLGRQTAFNDPRVKWALDVVERQGTALVVGSEIALGEPASAMRLKAILEPQAGHILTASPQFWETFFRRYRPFVQEQRTMIRTHLGQQQQLLERLPSDVTRGWTAEPIE